MIFRTKSLIPVLVVVCLVLVLFPFSTGNAEDITNVYISAPANIPVGSSFTARVNVAEVQDLATYQFQLNYDPNIIRVNSPEGDSSGVTAGLVGSASILVDMWSYAPPARSEGAVRVVGRLSGGQGVSGSGYLAEIHFQALGPVGYSTDITPTDTPTFKNGLFNSQGQKISAISAWTGRSVQVIPALEILTSGLPQCAVGSYYAINLEASGGIPSYTWNATGLPAGLGLSPEGIISGVPAASRDITHNKTYFNIKVSVNDALDSHLEKDLSLYLIWKTGDANGDGEVDMGDVIKLERIRQGLDPATPGADANQDGSLDEGDVSTIESIYLGLMDSPE